MFAFVSGYDWQSGRRGCSQLIGLHRLTLYLRHSGAGIK
jgi:hypothetical protein